MSLSNDVVQLVLDHLIKAQFPSQGLHPDTLEDIGSLAETLAKTAERCRTVMKPVKAESEMYGRTTALKQLESLLGWDHFLDRVKLNPVPVESTLLFRAHKQPITSPPLTFISLARERLLSENYQRVNSVQAFLRTINMHLGKTDLEKKGKKLVQSKFTSTSPDLDWTVHLAGQKARQAEEGVDWVGLVVFDLQKLSKTAGVTVIKVSEVLEYIRNSAYSDIIDKQYQIWASNCNEYLLMGQGISSGVLQLIPWTRLESMPIIHPCFITSYTLKVYCKYLDARMHELPITEHEEACQMVVESGKILAGEKSDNMKYLQQIVQLLLKPTVRFWAIRTVYEDRDVDTRCEMILQDGDGLIAKLSQVSV